MGVWKGLGVLLLASSLSAQSPVLLYHRIGDEAKPYTISADRLRSHLEYLRQEEHDLITFSQYASGLHDADKPAVLTFDDAMRSQFIIKDGIIDPETAVGILERFKEDNPGYRVTATFFLSTSPDEKGTKTRLFGQAGKEREKLEFLVANGYEVAAHGYGHPDFRKFTPEQARENIESFLDVIRSYAPALQITAFAYPLGSVPTPEVAAAVREYFPYTAGVGPAKDPSLIPRRDMSPREAIEKALP